jgi:hypothetical protein
MFTAESVQCSWFATGLRQRAEGELTGAQSAVINNKLREIEAMDTTGKLGKLRQSFARSLEAAKKADHSTKSRRAHAAEHIREAKKLRALIERIDRAYADFMAAMRDAAAVFSRNSKGREIMSPRTCAHGSPDDLRKLRAYCPETRSISLLYAAR